ncbi:60S acidic ribosomal protein P1 [Tritrichomonas musculus]|uniref:60S acidic ribosomal protein P1 n=1 Tax=Tritrichomonas musculus TaxID=1915356 RepID=A0ABR2HBS4_9EUKA
MTSPELSCVYASLILNDDNVEITSEKINTLLNAAGIKIDSYWADIFAEYCKTHDISEITKRTNLGGNSTTESRNQENSETRNEENKEKEGNKEEEIEIGGFDDLFG